MGGRDSDPKGEVRSALQMLLDADLSQCGFGDLDVLRGACQRVRGFVAAADVRIARRSRELCDEPHDPNGGEPPSGRDDGDGPPDAGADGAGRAGGSGGSGGSGGDGGAGGSGGDGADGGGSGSRSGSGVGDGSSFGGTTDRRSAAEVERDHQRSRVFASMPSFATALEAGRIDVGHVDALVAALGRIDHDEVRRAFVDRERELLGHAGVETPERFRRRCQDLARQLIRAHGVEIAARQKQAASARHWWNRRTGMFHLHLELEPELGAKIETAIDEHLATVRDRGTGDTWQRCRVDAVAELITHSRALDVRSPEVVVLVDWDTLRTGVLSPGGVCESHGGGELAPATVRRMACDAGIMPIVLGGDGVPLDAGRTRRLATREQRRALRAMYRTCAHPECDRPFSWCRMHHIVFWERLGLTDIDNLIPLCDRHHHLVHEGGWTLTMTPDRVCTWTTPSGRVWYHGDTRDALGPDHPSQRRVAGGADGPGDATDVAGAAGMTGATGMTDAAGAADGATGCHDEFDVGGSHGPADHDRPHAGRHDADDTADREPDGAVLVGAGTTRRAHRRSSSADDGDHTVSLFDHDIETAGP